MELPFRPENIETEDALLYCFNPCFNGIAFSTFHNTTSLLNYFCFNPCFNGIAFSTFHNTTSLLNYFCFNPCFNGIAFSTIGLFYLHPLSRWFQSLF